MDSAEKVQMSAAWLGPSNVEFRMGKSNRCQSRMLRWIS